MPLCDGSEVDCDIHGPCWWAWDCSGTCMLHCTSIAAGTGLRPTEETFTQANCSLQLGLRGHGHVSGVVLPSRMRSGPCAASRVDLGHRVVVGGDEPRAVPLGPPGALQTVAQSVSLSAEVNGSIEWREDG
jgi:hypothetical protein